MKEKVGAVLTYGIHIVSFLLVSTFSIAQQQFIRLGWSPNDEADLSHYVLYRDTEPGTMVFLTAIPSQDDMFVDTEVTAGSTYYYKLTAVDFAGNESEASNEVMATVGIITLIDDKKDEVIKDFALQQNYPNPFNPTTTIEYVIPRASKVSITIFNVTGQEIRRFTSEFKETGRYKIEWDGKDNHGKTLTSGIYFYQMIAGDYREVKRAVFQK